MAIEYLVCMDHMESKELTWDPHEILPHRGNGDVTVCAPSNDFVFEDQFLDDEEWVEYGSWTGPAIICAEHARNSKGESWEHHRHLIPEKYKNTRAICACPWIKEESAYFVSSEDGRGTKASGKEKVFASGMSRDNSAGKPRFDLILPKGMPYEELMLTRLAGLYARGGAIRGDRNWENANSEEDLDRFHESALRHAMQWAAGETDEDHAAGAVWNIFAAEYVKWKMKNG